MGIHSHYHSGKCKDKFLEIIQLLAQKLLPARCRLCEQLLSKANIFCSKCIIEPPVNSLKRCHRCFREKRDNSSACIYCDLAASALDSERFIWSYHGIAAEMLRYAKYRPDQHLFRLLARNAAIESIEYVRSFSPEMIVPIPSVSLSVRKKGYIPASIFANEICHYAFSRKLTFQERVLLKPYNERKRRIATLSIKDRIKEVKKTVLKPTLTACKKILLVDDLVTTGSSSRILAKLLKESGVNEIYLLSMMRKEPYLIPNFHDW